MQIGARLRRTAPQMGRQRRFDECGGYYHVTQAGLHGTPLFERDDDFAFFLSFLGRVTARDSWLCFSYCLMSTHYHLIVQRLESRSLGASAG